MKSIDRIKNVFCIDLHRPGVHIGRGLNVAINWSATIRQSTHDHEQSNAPRAHALLLAGLEEPHHGLLEEQLMIARG